MITAHGGDPVHAARLVAIFEAFCDADYQHDLDARRAEHGDNADQRPLPHTRETRLRRPTGRRLPELVTDIVVDATTVHETLATAGIVLPNGNQIELDDTGDIIDETALLTDHTQRDNAA